MTSLKTGDLIRLGRHNDLRGVLELTRLIHGWKPGSTGGPQYYFPNNTLGIFVRPYRPNPNMSEVIVEGVMCCVAQLLVSRA